MTSFLSKGTTFSAIIATMNLLLMAAIANDGSVGNGTSQPTILVPSTPTSTIASTTSTSTIIIPSSSSTPSRVTIRQLPILTVSIRPSLAPFANTTSKNLIVTQQPLSSTSTASASPSPTSRGVLTEAGVVSTTSARILASTTQRLLGSTLKPVTLPASLNLAEPSLPIASFLVGSKNYEGYPPSSSSSSADMTSKGGNSGSSSINNKDQSTSGSENSSISSSLNSMDSSTSLFITENSTELTAQIKSNALIPCIVRNSGDGVTVSWIRRKDYHLLTVGLQTYSSDDRFQAIHAQSPEDWTLKIKFVQPRDAGIYECQVSTHPPSSIFVKLNVVEARAEIPGGPDKFIKSGSTLRLVCEFKESTEEPDYVFWYQGQRMINYEPNRQLEVTHDRYTSTLVLHNVQKSDSANYSCAPSNAHPASIFVHIINGENPAAMQHGSHSTCCVPCPPLWFLSFLLSITLQTFYFHFLTQGHKVPDFNCSTSPSPKEEKDVEAERRKLAFNDGSLALHSDKYIDNSLKSQSYQPYNLPALQESR